MVKKLILKIFSIFIFIIISCGYSQNLFFISETNFNQNNIAQEYKDSSNLKETDVILDQENNKPKIDEIGYDYITFSFDLISLNPLSNDDLDRRVYFTNELGDEYDFEMISRNKRNVTISLTYKIYNLKNNNKYDIFILVKKASGGVYREKVFEDAIKTKDKYGWIKFVIPIVVLILIATLIANIILMKYYWFIIFK